MLDRVPRYVIATFHTVADDLVPRSGSAAMPRIIAMLGVLGALGSAALVLGGQGRPSSWTPVARADSPIEPAGASSRQGEAPDAKPETPVFLQVLLPVLTTICGALSALFLAQVSGARRDRAQRLAQETAFQLEYLGPLQAAAENLTWKVVSIEDKIRARQPGSGGLAWMLHTFHCLKEPREILGRTPTPAEHGYWCNGEGFFAASTIYALVVYLLHARRARRESAKHLEVVRRLGAVRVALGHEFGIFVMLQDSIGEYVGDEHGMEIGYRRFCAMLLDDDERPWFLNVLDYFREIDRKTPEQRWAIITALRELLSYLEAVTRLPVQDALAAHPGLLAPAGGEPPRQVQVAPGGRA